MHDPPQKGVKDVGVGLHLCCHRQLRHYNREVCPRCSGDLLVPGVGAVQGSEHTLCGGDILSHIAAALVGCPDGNAPGRASRVVLGIEKLIPVHKHEQCSADMQHVP